MTAFRSWRHSSQRRSVISHEPVEITPGGGGSPRGTPIAASSARVAAPRRASSAPASGTPRSAASDAARAAAAPRRRSGGGAGSSTVAPPTTWRRPGSLRSTRSPTWMGSGVSRDSRTTADSAGPTRSSLRTRTGTAAAPTCRTAWLGRSPRSTRASTTPVRAQAPGVSRASPRRTSSGRTPRRLRATRAGAVTVSAGCPRRCSARTVTVVSPSSSESPRRRVPATSVPVTTVPLPRTVNERSTQSRTRALTSAGGSLRARASRAPRSESTPAPVRPETLTAGMPARVRRGKEVVRLLDRRCGVRQVAPGHGDEAVPDAEGVEGPDVLIGLGGPALVGGDHEQDGWDRPDPGEHVGREALVARHVDKGDLLSRRQRRPCVAEIDGHSAPALLRPPVRLHPGERSHQGRLAVVDVTRGCDHPHASTAWIRASSSDGATQRRSRRQRPPSSRPTTAGSPARSCSA